MGRRLLSRVFYDDLAVTRTDRSYLGTLFGDARSSKGVGMTEARHTGMGA